MEPRDYRRIARDTLTDRWGEAVLVALVAGLLGGLITSSGTSLDLNISEEHLSGTTLRLYLAFTGILSLLGFVQFIIGGVIRQGYAHYLLKQYDRRDHDGIHELFSQFHRFGDGFLLMLLQSLFIFLWTLLLIVPGIIASLSYAMAPFILAENENMTPMEALRASKQLMDGHKMDLFLLGLSFLGWIILCTFTLGIGYLWLNPYMNAAYTAFYRSISRKRIIDAVE